ncbi:hypothetical protein B0T16DRAFT_418457, partial [Cercophora newfieldiana]
MPSPANDANVKPGSLADPKRPQSPRNGNPGGGELAHPSQSSGSPSPRNNVPETRKVRRQKGHRAGNRSKRLGKSLHYSS